MKYIKDKKITILKFTTTYNDYMEEVKEWIPLPGAANIWAYYRQLSGSEFYAAMTVNSKEEVLFVINWRDDLEVTMRVEYRGKQYEITRIDNFEGYKEDIKIYATHLN